MPNNFGNIKFQTLDGRELDAKLYCHSETVNVNGTDYYLLKSNTPADGTAVSLSASTGSVARVVWGKFVFPLSGIGYISSATINGIYRAYTTGGTVNAEIDIKILKSDNTVRTTIATGVSKSSSLGTSWSTLTGADYSFSGYDVEDQTDYLEIDYIANVTSKKSGGSAYLRIDDSSLSQTDQTRSQEWNFLGIVTKCLAISHNTISIVKKYLAIRHSTRNVVTKYLAIKHNTVNVVQKRISLNYFLYSLIEKTVSLEYYYSFGEWFHGWAYRKSHVVNSASGAGTNYQVKITVYYGSGTDSGENVYLNSHCRTDFGDIRFTKSDRVTLLDYWMESKTDSNNAVFWVKIADDLSTNAVVIYLYYGNPTATTTSNGTNTFDDFDDFLTDTLANYVQIDSGWSINTHASGYLVSPSSGEGFIAKSKSLSRAYAVRARVYMSAFDAGVGFIWGTAGGSKDSISGYIANYYPSTTYSQLLKYVSGSSTKLANLPESNVGWYIMEIRATSSTLTVITDTTQDANVTDTTFTTLNGVGFRQNSTSTNLLDWWVLRKFVYPEPSHGSWGSEETNLVKKVIFLNYSSSYVQKIVSLVYDYYDSFYNYSGWYYSKKFKVCGSDSAGTDYAIRVTVHYGSGTDSGEHVYLNNKCRSDFGDIRFSTSNPLDYWMERYVASDYAIFWIKVSDDLSYGNDVYIRIWYGNPEATTTSSGISTFPFFDDFDADLSKWTVRSGTWTLTTDGGYSVLQSPINNNTQIATSNFTILNCRIKTRFRLNIVTVNDYYGVMARTPDSNNSYYEKYGYPFTFPRHEIYKCVSGSTNERLGYVNLASNTNYHISEFLLYGTSLEAYIDGAYALSFTDTYHQSTASVGLRHDSISYPSSSAYFFVDWFLVGKYVDPEPSICYWGFEETFISKIIKILKLYQNIAVVKIYGKISGIFSVLEQGLQTIYKSNIQLFYILNFKRKSYQILHTLRNKRYSTFTVKEKILNSVLKLFKPIWNLRNRIYDFVRSSYNVKVIVKRMFKQLYNLKNLVRGSIRAIYLVKNKISKVFKYYWKVRIIVRVYLLSSYGILNKVYRFFILWFYALRNVKSKSFLGIYKILNVKRKLLSAKWNLRNVLHVLKSFIWKSCIKTLKQYKIIFGLRNRVSYSIRLIYNVRNLISKKFYSIYKLINKVYDSVRLVYSIRNRIYRSHRLLYSIINKVYDFIKPVYHIRNRIYKSSKLLYGVIGKIFDYIKLAFTIRNRVYKTSKLLYSIINKLHYALSTKWNIRNILQKRIVQFYSLRNKTLKLYRSIYNVRTAIFDLIKLEYNILHSVIAKASAKYGINNLVKSAIFTTYRIFGKTILKTKILVYSTLSKVYSKWSLYYYIRNLISDYIKLQYSTLNSVKDHLTVIWKTLNKSALLFKANYNIRNLISIRKSMLYSIRKLVKISFNVKFSLRNLIRKAFVPIYFVLHIVYNSIIQAYSIRNLIVNLKELKYSISKKVYYAFKQLYNIRNRIYGLFRVKHNILNLIIAKLLPIYTIRNIVSEILKIRYTILGKAIAVFKTSRYSIRNRVQIERTAIYGIMNLVHASLSSLYLLYNRISRSLSKLYGISGIISKMLVANWNILSKIYIGVSFKWSSLLFRKVKLAVSYGIRSLIKSMLNVRHNLSGLIVKELLYSWNILNKRINSISAVFNVRNLSKSVISLSYEIINSIIRFVRSSYNIMNKVSEIVSANYNLFKGVYASLQSVFKIKSLVKSVLILQHGIFARIKSELKSLWNIGYEKITRLLKSDWNVQYVIENLIISIRSLPIYSTAKTNIFVSYRRLFKKFVMLEKTIKEVLRRLFRRVVM